MRLVHHCNREYGTHPPVGTAHHGCVAVIIGAFMLIGQNAMLRSAVKQFP